MMTESRVVESFQMLSVIIQVPLAQSRGVEIGSSCRIPRGEGHGKDPVLSGILIDSSHTDRRCGQAGRWKFPARNLLDDQIYHSRRDVKI